MNKDFLEIRQLLTLWYEGLTTPEQEQQLIDTFGVLPAESVPDDLKPDHAIFSAMSVQVNVTEAEADHAIDAAIRRSRKLPRRLPLTRVAAAAAAIILISGALTFIPLQSLTSGQYEQLAANAHNAATPQKGNLFSLPKATISTLANTANSNRIIFSKFYTSFSSQWNSITTRHRPASPHPRSIKAHSPAISDTPKDYITPSPEEASVLVSESWQLMASLLSTTVDEASTATQDATRSASADIQNAITASNAGLEQIHDITDNIIN